MAALVVTSLGLAGCSSDSEPTTTSAAPPPPTVSSPIVGTAPTTTTNPLVSTTAAQVVLTEEQRSWCSFTGQSDEDALRFDDIFEAGRSIGLRMDSINALAAGLRAQYESSGMTPDEAVRAVSDELLENEDFKAACAEAYGIWVGG